MEQEKPKGFSYRLPPSELFYLVFGKKKCPKCGEKLIKQKKWRAVKGRELNKKQADPIFIPNADIKSYYYEFQCENCRSVFSLSELAKKKS